MNMFRPNIHLDRQMNYSDRATFICHWVSSKRTTMVNYDAIACENRRSIRIELPPSLAAPNDADEDLQGQ